MSCYCAAVAAVTLCRGSVDTVCCGGGSDVMK